MKLIDILAEELPKRGGWPKGADYCIQHAHDLGFRWVIFNKGIVNSTSADAEGKWEMDWEFSHKHDFCADELASDHTTAIITREQYEAALAAKNEGWIEWRGGRRPVDDVTEVDIKFRTGGIAYGVEAGKYYWPRTGREYDIIAYRLHKPQEAEQAKADDEADLNECIGQDAAPVWSGEGQPSVGVECEYSWAGEPWASGVIRYISKHTIIIETQADSTGDTECAYHPTDIKLRPLRTEADRKRDAAVEAIDRYMPEFIPDTPNDYYNAKKIYDAIAAGKIPGVKLDN